MQPLFSHVIHQYKFDTGPYAERGGGREGGEVGGGRLFQNHAVCYQKVSLHP